MSVLAALLGSLILCAATGDRLTTDALADQLAKRDVVFLGEEHDNTEGHSLQAEILEKLWQRRPDLVLSMEMFERDVQGVLDDYLRGRIDEKLFLARARPWPNYAKHYRPLVEFARAKGLDVLAANVPRDLARRISSKGIEAVQGQLHAPRKTSAPEDRYLELFRAAMSDHVGADGDVALRKMYASQCLKDDAMAETITDYLVQHAHRRPLVVHVCGKFHSDYGLGTAVRVLERRPLALLGVVTMVAAEDPESVKVEDHAERGHFILAVKEEEKPKAKDAPPKVEAKAEAEAPPAAEAVVETVVVEGAPADPARAVVPVTPVTPVVPVTPVTPVTPITPAAPVAPAKPEPPAEEPIPEGAKPALGIMPDYGATDPGVTIAGVREDGAAAKAGLKDGDRLVKIAGKKIEDIEEYMHVLEGLKAGQTVDVVIVRAGKEETIKVKLGVSTRH